MVKVFNMDDYGLVAYNNEGDLIFRHEERLNVNDEEESFELYETIYGYDEEYEFIADTKCCDNDLGRAFEFGINKLKLNMSRIENFYSADSEFFRIEQERELKLCKIREINEILHRNNVDNVSLEKLEALIKVLATR